MAKQVQAEIIVKLNASGIRAASSRPEVLRHLTWYGIDNLRDPDLDIQGCLRLFRKKFGVMPKFVVLDGEHHAVYQWHPTFPQPPELVEAIRQARVGKESRPAKKKSRR